MDERSGWNRDRSNPGCRFGSATDPLQRQLKRNVDGKAQDTGVDTEGTMADHVRQKKIAHQKAKRDPGPCQKAGEDRQG
ncbi:MAG: hypothetical protein U9R74_00385 [Pseudomonadota bacterium]|nr:hypothetical protein [Pseudomonadota bacterium]